MLIRMSDLPASGMKLSGPMDVEPLNARLSEGSPCEIRFDSNPILDLTILPLPEGGELSGSVSATYLQPCGRCLAPKTRLVTLELNFHLKPGTPSEIGDDEPGLILYLGDYVDIAPHIYDSLILSLSQYWCPSTDSTGRCTECSSLVNQSTSTPSTDGSGKLSLAVLLKKAGIQ